MIKEKMKGIINERKQLDAQDDYSTGICWKKEIELLTSNIKETIDYLNSASEEEILWSSEIWYKVSNYFKSGDLIDAMNNQLKRFPNLKNDIQQDIDSAILELDDTIFSLIDDISITTNQEIIDAINKKIYAIVSQSIDYTLAFLRQVKKGIDKTCDLWPLLVKKFKDNNLIKEMEKIIDSNLQDYKRCKLMLEEAKKGL